MIGSRGLGDLIVVFVVASVFLTHYCSEKLTGDDQFYQKNKWIVLFAMTLASFLTWCLDRLLKRRKARVVIDKETGEEFILRVPHSFLFIPLRFWVFILMAAGVVMAVVSVVSKPAS